MSDESRPLYSDGEIEHFRARTQALLCLSEQCDGREHRCLACSGMGYMCHITHGTRCRFCDGRGRWACPVALPGGTNG